MGERVKLVVCNEPQNCGTIKALEAEVKRLRAENEARREQKEYLNNQTLALLETLAKKREGLEARLAKAQELTDKLCNTQPDPYDDAYHDSAPYLTMRRQIGRVLKKALGDDNIKEIQALKEFIYSDSGPHAEIQRKLLDAESRLRSVENFLEDLKHRPYVPPWLITGLNSALCDGEAAVKEVPA